MKVIVGFAAALLLLAISGASAAQEEEAFERIEYGPWTTDGDEAFVSTTVYDGENRLIIQCGPSGYAGIATYHRLLVASDDDGSVGYDGWGNTVSRGTVTAHFANGRKVVTPISVYVENEDGPYGPILGFEPATRKGEWYDAADGAFITSLMDANSIIVVLNGRGKNLSMSFSGEGSKRAITRGYLSTWCLPSKALQ